MAAELVIRRTQSGMFRCRAVLAAVDHALPVLDARAQGERLLLHVHAAFAEHFKGVPGTVADGENQRVRGNFFPAVQRDRGDFSILDAQAGKSGLKAHLAAQADDLPAQVANHCAQVIGADVGLGLVEDFLRCAHAVEGFQHLAAALILDAGVELAIGKGACAALAKLHVAGGVERSARPEGLHIRRTGIHIPAPFDHQRLQPRLRQAQRGEQARRAHAADHRAVLPGFELRNGGSRFGCGQNFRVAGQKGRGAPHFHIQGEGEMHVPLVPGVHGFSKNARGQNFVGAQLQRPRGDVRQRAGSIVQAQPELGDAYGHGLISFNGSA